MSARRVPDVDIAVITGISGAGRSEAAKALEDIGYFVVDNLPPALIETMVSLALAPGNDIKRLALVIDARGGKFFEEAYKALEELHQQVGNYRVLFLEASTDVLVRRFDASRRKHPLASADRVVVGIERERELMGRFREDADLIIDSSELSVQELRSRISMSFAERGDGPSLNTTIVSFGYKFGLPLDADIVLDLRFLPNPHWVDSLRPLTGLDEPVRDYVMGRDEAGAFLESVKDLFALLLPAYEKEGRHYLTVALGCTGGRHRSVALAEELAAFVRDKGFAAQAVHRDVDRPGQR